MDVGADGRAVNLADEGSSVLGRYPGAEPRDGSDPLSSAEHLPIVIGLAVADGTGEELGDVFRTAVAHVCETHRGTAEIVTCPSRFRTYGALARDNLSPEEAAGLAESDAAAYVDWLRRAFGMGMRVVFRTAFNAQSLYLAREALLGGQARGIPTSGGRPPDDPRRDPGVLHGPELRSLGGL